MRAGLTPFLRAEGTLWLFWLAVVGLFLGIAALAGLPLAFMGYAAGLTLVLLGVVLTVRFVAWSRRRFSLERLHPDDPGALADFVARHPHDAAGEALMRFALASRTLQAEREDRERGREEYFSLWVHQIKTPLAAMALLLDAEDLSRGDLLRERQRIEGYVGLALAYLKLERPGADLEIRMVEVDELVRRVLRRSKTLFLGSHTRLSYSPTGLRVLSDAAQLEIVIEQLVSNSLKYASGGTVRIAAEPVEAATLVIADDGPGLRPEEHPRLFEKGYAGLAGRQRSGSSGLGLFLCHQICERLGHRLRLESAPGEGTRALLTLSDAPSGEPPFLTGL